MRENINSFDWLAPFYDQITCVFFAGAIQQSHTWFLDQVPKGANVLILGGGTGNWVKSLLIKNESCRICYIEASVEMLNKAKFNLKDFHQIEFIHGTEEDIPQHQFDVIITAYFLDLFTDAQLKVLVHRLSHHLKNNCSWIVADFVNSNYWQNLFLGVMYFFFSITNTIKNRTLPNWDSCLKSFSFKEAYSKQFYSGFIHSKFYKRNY